MENIEFTNIYFFNKNIYIDFGKRFSNSFFCKVLNQRLAKEKAEEDINEANYIVVNSTNPQYNEHQIIHISEEKANSLFEEYKNDGDVKVKL